MTGATPGKQAHQAKDNKTNLKMNSTDKPNTDEELKEETQTDLDHNILLLSETSENGREALTSPDWSYADRRFLYY